MDRKVRGSTPRRDVGPPLRQDVVFTLTDHLSFSITGHVYFHRRTSVQVLYYIFQQSLTLRNTLTWEWFVVSSGVKGTSILVLLSDGTLLKIEGRRYSTTCTRIHESEVLSVTSASPCSLDLTQI